MPNKKPQEPVVRSASYTNRQHDEVELIYPHEGRPDDQENGKKRRAYYPVDRYTAKQAEHGLDIYPNPTPHNL